MNFHIILYIIPEKKSKGKHTLDESKFARRESVDSPKIGVYARTPGQ